jgi:hypothetical protein
MGTRARLMLLGLGAVLATGACLAGAGPASAGVDHELAIFSQCPTEVPGVTLCVYSTTTAGEFHLGSKTVPVEGHTIVLQGGLKNNESSELVPAKNGETVSKTPLALPGGLIGVELLPGVLPPLTEVTATAEPAGTITVSTLNVLRQSGVGVSMPLKVKLDNLALGSTCYVGSNAEPISLQLTTGTTNPPSPNKPITGSRGTPELIADNKIAESKGSELVDNSFSAPGANGCDEPLSVVADQVVDLDSGLPAAAGTNTAILKGSFFEAGAKEMKSQLALPEVGRCVHLKPEIVNRERHFHGLYKDAGCTEETTFSESEYEWEPGALNKAVTVEGKALSLETASKQKLTCLESHGSGEYTGGKSASLGLTLTGCTLGKAKEPCESSGAGSGTIVANGLGATLGFIKDEATHVTGESGGGVNAVAGWDISHGSSPLFSAQCGSQAVTVGGSVIAPVGVFDKMTIAQTLKFTQVASKQAIQSFEEQPNDTLSATIGGGSPEAAGLQTAPKVTSGERLEVKGIVE